MPSHKSRRDGRFLQSSKSNRTASKTCEGGRPPRQRECLSALAGLEAALHLVDDVNPALAADQTVGAVATTQRFQRVTDLHLKNPGCSEGRGDRPDLAKSGFPAGRSCRLRDGAVSKPLTRQMSTQMARFRPDLSSRRPALQLESRTNPAETRSRPL